MTVNSGKNILGPGSQSAIAAASVALTSNSGAIGTGAKGVATNPLRITTDSLSASAGTAGSAYILSLKNNPLTLTAGSGKYFYLEAIQKTSVTGPLTGSNVTLISGSTGDLLISSIIGDGTGAIRLDAGSGARDIILQTNISGLVGLIAQNFSVNNLSSTLLTIYDVSSSGTINLTTGGALLQSVHLRRKTQPHFSLPAAKYFSAQAGCSKPISA